MVKVVITGKTTDGADFRKEIKRDEKEVKRYSGETPTRVLPHNFHRIYHQIQLVLDIQGIYLKIDPYVIIYNHNNNPTLKALATIYQLKDKRILISILRVSGTIKSLKK